MTIAPLDDLQFNLRMPPGLRDQVREAAAASGRSMNAEIVYRLHDSLDTVADHEVTTDYLEKLSEITRQLDVFIASHHGTGDSRPRKETRKKKSKRSGGRG